MGGIVVKTARPPKVSTAEQFRILTGGREPVVICSAELRGIRLEQLVSLVSFLKSWSPTCRHEEAKCKSAEKAPPLHVTVSRGEQQGLSSQGAFAHANLYDVCDAVIKPLTAEAQCSYVEAVAEHVTFQIPSFFVSHWWGEPVAEFVECIVVHTRTRELGEVRSIYWVCAYANNQHELGKDLGSSPRESSFFKAMSNACGVLLILDQIGPATPFKRMWCCYEQSFVVSASSRDQPLLLDIASFEAGNAQLLTDGLTEREARMEEAHKNVSVNPSGWQAKSQRESAFPLQIVRAGLQISIARAQASREVDRRRILNSIASRPDVELDEEPDMAHPAYEEVDASLRAIFAVAAWRQAVERQEDISDTGGLPLKKVLRKSSRKKLTLNFASSSFTDSNMADVAESLPTILEEFALNCSECQLTNAGLHSMALGLKGAASLVVLRLGFANCTYITSVTSLANAMSLATSLHVLQLDFQKCCSLCSLDGLSHWFGALSCLATLEISFAQCSALDSVDELGSGLRGLRRLETLRFDCSSCGITSLDSFCSGLVGLPRLRMLRLSAGRCASLQVGDVMWESLASLSALTSMQVNLSHCCGVLSVAGLASYLPRLKYLVDIDLNFHYCPSLSPYLQWKFESIESFTYALARGGQGLRCIRGADGRFEVNDEQEVDEDNLNAAAGATSKCSRKR